MGRLTDLREAKRRTVYGITSTPGTPSVAAPVEPPAPKECERCKALEAELELVRAQLKEAKKATKYKPKKEDD